jgi:hypothetical protein
MTCYSIIFLRFVKLPSCIAARKPYRNHVFRHDVADPPGSITRCGDRSHTSARTRNVLIPLQKETRVPRSTQKRDHRARNSQGSRIDTKQVVCSIAGRVPIRVVACEEFTACEMLETRRRNTPIEGCCGLPVPHSYRAGRVHQVWSSKESRRVKLCRRSHEIRPARCLTRCS